MINNKIGGHNMVGRAVNRLAGRLTAVALTAAMGAVRQGSGQPPAQCGMCCGWKEYRDGSKEGVQAFCDGADECEK